MVGDHEIASVGTVEAGEVDRDKEGREEQRTVGNGEVDGAGTRGGGYSRGQERWLE